MRVCLFFTFGVSLAMWEESGLLARELALYQKLASRGVEYVFVTYGGDADLAYASRWPGISVRPLFTGSARAPGKIESFVRSWLAWRDRRFFRSFHLLKTNQMWGAWTALAAGRAAGRPVLVRCGYDLVHNNTKEFSVQPPSLKNQLRLGYDLALARSACALACKVTLTTEPMARTARERYGLSPAKAVIIPNYVETDRFRPLDGPLPDNRRVVFVGALRPEKNLEALVEASALAGVGLDIVGDGPLRRTLEEAAARHEADVTFLGKMSTGDLPEVLRRYPVFALPSLYEGHPKALIEAMGCGLAVLGADVPGIRELLRHNDTGLLAGIAAGELARGLGALFADASLRQRLGRSARQEVERRFSLERVADLELAAYREILETRLADRREGL